MTCSDGQQYSRFFTYLLLLTMENSLGEIDLTSQSWRLMAKLETTMHDARMLEKRKNTFSAYS